MSGLVKAGLVVAVLVASGAAAGVLWEWMWQPPLGVVRDGQWFPASVLDLQRAFSGTGVYVVLAAAVALVVTCTLVWTLPGDELLVLVAVCVGSVLAGWVMYRTGHALGPADPEVLTGQVRRGTQLPDDLSVTAISAKAVFPLASLLGLAVTMLTGHGRRQA